MFSIWYSRTRCLWAYQLHGSQAGRQRLVRPDGPLSGFGSGFWYAGPRKVSFLVDKTTSPGFRDQFSLKPRILGLYVCPPHLYARTQFPRPGYIGMTLWQLGR
jgi:hypothetical protein